MAKKLTKADILKKALLESLTKSRGIVSIACKKAGCTRETYYKYYNNDKCFKESADEMIEIQLDFVESKLLDNISKNDTASIIFYLKTKGKKRGYSENERKNTNTQPIIVIKDTDSDVFKSIFDK